MKRLGQEVFREAGCKGRQCFDRNSHVLNPICFLFCTKFVALRFNVSNYDIGASELYVSLLFPGLGSKFAIGLGHSH